MIDYSWILNLVLLNSMALNCACACEDLLLLRTYFFMDNKVFIVSKAL